MKLFIQAPAEADLFHQIEWYAEQGLPNVAMRFSAAVRAGIEATLRKPLAGAPKKTSNLALSGLRTWPVKGFEEHRIYYLVFEDRLQIIRILHGRRDVGAIIDGQEIDDPAA